MKKTHEIEMSEMQADSSEVLNDKDKRNIQAII